MEDNNNNDNVHNEEEVNDNNDNQEGATVTTEEKEKKARRDSNREEQLFVSVKIAIDAVRENQQYKDQLAIFGPIEKILNEGEKLYDKAFDYYTKQIKALAEKLTTQDKKSKLYKKMKKQYLILIKIARKLFSKDRGILSKLGLTGSRKTTFSGLLAQEKQFFINVLSDNTILTGYTEIGAEKANFEKLYAEVNELEKLNILKEQAKADSKKYTKLRDQSVKKLELWYKSFKLMAQFILPGPLVDDELEQPVIKTVEKPKKTG